MKTYSIVTISLLGLAFASAAQAQGSTATAELQGAATGDSFKIGDTEFRMAPAASVRPISPLTDPDKKVVVAQYEVSVGQKAVSGSRSKRSLDVLALPADPILRVAMSETGAATVVTSSLNVYFNEISVLSEAVRQTGGKLTYSSAIGGKGVIKFESVAAALAAMKLLQGKAGIKEVSPQVVQSLNVPM